MCSNKFTFPRHLHIGLRSFHYRGDYLRFVALPHTCFGDLYISFPRPGVGWRLHNWIDALPNLSNLTVLTVCSNALRIVSILHSRESLQPKLANLSNLQNLRELQLLMYAMGTVMLSDIYGFLRICGCSQLRKLFVELPKFRMDSFMDAVSDLAEEPMEGFENLVTAKITNFKWQCNEIELVHFLFRKDSSLQKLILVAPPGTHPERDQSGNPFFRDTKLLRMEKAPSNAQVTMLRAHLGAKIQAFHRDVNLLALCLEILSACLDAGC
nr:uncharacterized protein LOC117853696 [Setaria viridis]